MEIFNEIDSELAKAEDTFISGEKSDEMIDSAEDALSVKLPKSFKFYLKKYGNVSFGPFEFLGLTNHDDFENATVPNCVWFTLKKRKEIGLPKNLVVFHDRNGEEFYCLDTSTVGGDGECPIVVWDNIEKEVGESLNGTFADILMETLEEYFEIFQ